jgi:hypothetical protein
MSDIMPTLTLECPTEACDWSGFGNIMRNLRQDDTAIELGMVRRYVDGAWLSFSIVKIDAPQQTLDAICAAISGSLPRIAGT